MKVKLPDLMQAFEFVSFGEIGETQAYLSKETGEIYYYSEISGDTDELPDDIDDDEKYIEIPHKKELDLGKQLVLSFATSHMPEDYEKIAEMFRKKGAYSRFKDFLERKGMLQNWYDYEEQQEEQALREWCEEEGIEIGD